MGATSISGVGLGAAAANRGPGNGRNQFVSLLDPHVVFHGTVNSEGGLVNVDLPDTVWDIPENLMILVTGKSTALGKNVNGDGLVTGFTIGAAKNIDFDFVVVKSPSSLFTPNNYA